MSSELIGVLPFPALLIGSDGRIWAANPAAEEIVARDCVGHDHVSMIRQPMLLEAIDAALRAGVRAQARFVAADAAGDVNWVAHVAPFGQPAEVIVTFEDRTAAQQAGEMRRDFVANVSHELRTPLTALLGFIETLKGTARDDPEARDRFLDIMEREAARMNRLIGDLLSLNRVEAEERVRPSDRVDLAGLAHSAASALAQLAKSNGVTLRTAGLDVAAEVIGDPDQLSQVLTNLIENAIKYAGAGSEVTVSIEMCERDPAMRGPAVVLAVTDTGAGIDPIHIPRLTERFYRVDGHRSRAMGGTGLGLAIVKHIVNRHRGHLRITSEPGRGSAFRVVLPALTDDDGSSGDAGDQFT